MGVYRYLRFTINSIRGATGATQLSIFNLLDANDNRMSWAGATATASTPGFNNEGAENILDNQTSTKYCANYTSGMYITIDAGSGNGFDLAIYNKYQWYTANDEPARDPVSWIISASNNGTNWKTLAQVSNATILTERYTLAYTGLLEDKYYLIESGGSYYTISTGSLVNIGNTLNAQLFIDYGLADLPTWAQISSLADPSVLCWTNTEAEHMTAITTGTPLPQTIYSEGVDLTSPDINGIETIIVTSSGDPLFAFSIDGSIWKVWDFNNEVWATLTQDNTGMSAATVEEISSSNWATFISGATEIYIKWCLLTTSDSVTEVLVDYLN